MVDVDVQLHYLFSYSFSPNSSVGCLILEYFRANRCVSENSNLCYSQFQRKVTSLLKSAIAYICKPSHTLWPVDIG